jgi:hypothetical protein
MKDDSLIRLPEVLESSNDFRALNAEQQKAFRERLQHCAQLAHDLADVQGELSSELFAMIDDAELDAISIMSAATDPATTVSPYRVHSSWMFECDRKAMSSKVERSTATFLGSPAFLPELNSAGLAEWLKRWAAAMQNTFRQLARAPSFSDAIAQLLVVDALIAILLVFTSAARLNPNG